MNINRSYLVFISFSLAASCSQVNTKEKPVVAAKENIAKNSEIKIVFQPSKLKDSCFCDSNAVKKLVRQKSFNSIAQFDTKLFSTKKFYELDSQTNRILWFRDIENPTKTKFTELWDAYSEKNYYADPTDFINFYEGRKDVPLAFIFGPNNDLWAYHIFVIKKIECCYLITRSYYRHNRFTYKAFAVFDNNKLKELYSTITKIHLLPAQDRRQGYSGYFIENLSHKTFLIDFENEVVQSTDSSNQNKTSPKPEIRELFNFVDKKFQWIKTYD